jgi:transketolase C-terminal domain/subunit
MITFVFRGHGIPTRCVGIEDKFGQSAQSYRELQEAYGLTADHIAACALEIMKQAPQGQKREARGASP